MQNDLVLTPLTQTDGWVYPPTDKPGLGIEINEDVVNKYRQK